MRFFRTTLYIARPVQKHGAHLFVLASVVFMDYIKTIKLFTPYHTKHYGKILTGPAACLNGGAKCS